ncbi:XRE family transcriptional regulator [Rhizobium sp. SSA_523]|uniref:helix-turn-helix domain-containing protein n=1 Tax=Rhizobium sp. SSA_523 TaxID=2952477 RepID=UPI0020906C02|nr:XRE family transcriptional regulator [Rhizobium sp. SSA_523]MCO5731701.1 XRE family transcriptional regulator [Rhizobium sp. SSA_523]WKC22923.1 XRE family transcriptional regulator [Rhizobium sp. SSA_523]
MDVLTDAIAACLRGERERRAWSLAELAERSGVSKAMISKIERCEASPTATVLGRLSGAFGLPLSALLSIAERSGEKLVRAADQPVWTDPETGYQRRALSPVTGGGLEVIEVMLPPGVRIPYPAAAFAFQRQQILILAGCLDFTEGDVTHRLQVGDCLELGAPQPCLFSNASSEAVRYLVVLARR